VTQSQLTEVEAKLRLLSRRLEENVQRHEMLAGHQEAQREVERVLAELAKHQQDRSGELERLKRQIEDHLQTSLRGRAEEMEKVKRAMDEHLRATLNERTAEMERVKRDIDQHLQATRQARDTRETEVAMLKHGRNLGPVDGPAAAGDVVEVRIGGEPDLPTHYDIRADGTIRLPFLGSFKVVGQTAAQVQAAIGKQMSDRKLGPANQVTVGLLRRK